MWLKNLGRLTFVLVRLKKKKKVRCTSAECYLILNSKSQLKNFPTYESAHDYTAVTLPGSRCSEQACEIFKYNRDKCEKHGQDIYSAIEEY